MTGENCLQGRDDESHCKSVFPPSSVVASQGEDEILAPSYSPSPSPDFQSAAKMIGLEDPNEEQPFLNTMNLLQAVVSNLECFKFTDQRKLAIRKMAEEIRMRTED